METRGNRVVCNRTNGQMVVLSGQGRSDARLCARRGSAPAHQQIVDHAAPAAGRVSAARIGAADVRRAASQSSGSSVIQKAVTLAVARFDARYRSAEAEIGERAAVVCARPSLQQAHRPDVDAVGSSATHLRIPARPAPIDDRRDSCRWPEFAAIGRRCSRAAVACVSDGSSVSRRTVAVSSRSSPAQSGCVVAIGRCARRARNFPVEAGCEMPSANPNGPGRAVAGADLATVRPASSARARFFDQPHPPALANRSAGGAVRFRRPCHCSSIGADVASR